MPESLRLERVQLRVRHLARSLEFYLRQLGFAPASQGPGRADLATEPGGPGLLTLLEAPDAPSRSPTEAGLFHAALLLPSRASLGAWLAAAHRRGVPFDGFGDHGVSEAVYLSDPDGNGLEFYRDRPRAEWPLANGELAMTTDPVDIEGLLGEAPADAPGDLRGARWGHLHLRVTQLDRSEAFYRSALGLDVMQRSLPGARFLAADGYHHHLGLNVWGQPRSPQDPDTLGLAEATFARAGVTKETRVRDPDGIQLRLTPLAAPAKIP